MIETNFKHTDIGLIPHDWVVKRIGDSAPLQRGFDLPHKNLILGDYPVVYSNGVGNYHCKYLIKGPGVITGRSGTIGKIHYVNENYWPHNTTLWVTNFYNNYPLFIYYLFNTFNWLRFSTGTGVPTLNRNFVHDEIIALPPTLAEQEKIANALSKIDQLINDLGALIEKKKAIKQGTMQDLLTAKRRLKGFTGEWRDKKLDEMGFLTAGGTPSTIEPSYWGGDINWLQSGAVQNCIITPDAVVKTISKEGLQNSATYLIKPDSVLIAITGATCANVGYLTFESAANQSVVSIEPNKENCAMFLFQKLLTERTNILSNKGGSAQSGVTLKALKQLTITIPPTIAEQRAIAAVLSGMDTEIAALEQKRNKYIAIKQGMMQNLLTGKIRLI